MARLIDADALRQTMESNLYWGLDSDGAILDTIDEAPTVDAVEVVRCKDCKHSYKSSGSTTGYRCCRWGIYDEDCDCDSNGFCHKGERRSDNAAD